MKPLAHVAFALVLAGLQAAVLRWVGGGAFTLSLLPACVVYLGLTGSNVEGSIAAAGIGYVLDLVCGTPKGLMTFLSVALFVLVRGAGAAVDVRGRAGFAALSAVGAGFLSLGAGILTRYTAGAEGAPGLSIIPRLLLEALLSAAASPIVFAGMRRIDGLFHREEPGLLR